MAAAPILTNIAAGNPRLRHGKAVKTTMTMKKTTTFLTAALAAKLLAVAIVFTSCVSKKQFVNLQKDYATVQNELSTLQSQHSQTLAELAGARAEVKSLDKMLDEEKRRNAELKEMYRNDEVRCLKTVELGLEVFEAYAKEKGLVPAKE